MFALIAVAGGAYPAAMRATGLSYMVGVSRFAAAISPLAGGALLGMGYETIAVLSLLIVPITIAALASLLLPRAMPKGLA
jgi:AAHS family 4-hydroxybenzoate transporter-like MFS transporter